MNINNLTNVYNSNPTLQGQYTLQQYLDLFDQGSYTPIQPTPTPTPTPDPGIPSIINQNINQYQNQGGDKDDGNTNVVEGGKDYGYTGTGSTGSTTGFNIEDIAEGTIDSDEASTGKFGLGTLASIAGFFANPLGFFGTRVAKKGYDITQQRLAKKALEKELADIEKQKEKQAQIEINRIQASNQQNKTGGYQSSWSGNNDFMDGPSDAGRGNNPGDKGGSDSMGSFARGGSVRKYFKGGIVSLRGR